MKIMDISFVIRATVLGENRKQVFQEDYQTFSKLNEWLKEAEKNPGYKGCYMSLEVIEEGSIMPTFGYGREEVSSYSEEELEVVISHSFHEVAYLLKATGSKMVTLRPIEPEKETLKLENEGVYVCERCFNPIEECICQTPSWHGICIDKPMLKIIRTLNQKGYRTRFCCCGHPQNRVRQGHYSDELYIAFDQNYGLEDLPEGCTYIKTRREICAPYKFKNTEEGLRIRGILIERMERWCEEL